MKKSKSYNPFGRGALPGGMPKKTKPIKDTSYTKDNWRSQDIKAIIDARRFLQAEDIKYKFKQARIQATLTRPQMAKLIDTSVQYVKDVENGDRYPSRMRRRKWATACGYNKDFFEFNEYTLLKNKINEYINKPDAPIWAIRVIYEVVKSLSQTMHPEYHRWSNKYEEVKAEELQEERRKEREKKEEADKKISGYINMEDYF